MGLWSSIIPIVLAVVVCEYWRPYDQWRLQRSIVIEKKNIREKYDFIVVGGGTSGSVVAARLSELADVSVLVLEAGHDDEDVPETQWLLTEQRLQLGEFDWQYKTVPQRNCCDSLVDKKNNWPRGKGLGGCSAHNGGVHVRGNRLDYDQWNSQFDGKGGWSYQDVLPYFKKLEDVSNVEQFKSSSSSKELRGFHGPTIVTLPPMSPLGNSFRDAIRSQGFKWLEDYNSAEQEGFANSQRARRPDGRRMATSEGYLRPAARLRPDRLHVLTKAHVTKILFDHGSSSGNSVPKAIGVQFMHDNTVHEVHARAEVVISGGSVNTPQLLMLSGIGPAEHLKEHGVPVILNNPAVGQNMLDHPFVHLSGTVNESVTYRGIDFDDPLAYSLAKAKYYLFGTGPLTNNAVEWTAFLRSGLTEEPWPDTQLYLINAAQCRPHNAFNLNEKGAKSMEPDEAKKSGRYLFGLWTILLKPHNSGEIRLRSSNPFDHPVIDPKYLDNQIDLRIVAKGLKILVDLAKSDHLKKYDLKLVDTQPPGCEHLKLDLESDEYLQCHARSTMSSMYHPVGTCRMGKEGRNSVVDERLRVHGVTNLRIVDASIFPYQIAGNTNVASIMIGEKGADMIKQDFANTKN